MIDPKLRNKQSKVYDHCETKLKQYARLKMHLDRLWFTSILFYKGEQWITFDTSLGQFRRTNQRRVIPRPVTNRFAAAANSQISALSRFDPKILFAPQSDSYEDLTMAKAAVDIIKVIDGEINRENLKAEMLPWYVITGNVFEIWGHDASGGGMKTVVETRCSQCGLEDTREENEEPGICQQCAEAEGLQSFMLDVVGPDGQPVTREEPAGKLGVEIGNPFQMFFDYRIPHIQDQQTIIRIHTKDTEYLRQKYPRLKDSIQPFKRSELNSRMLQSLSGYFYTASEGVNEETTDLVEVWHKPCLDFPRGYYAVYTCEQTFLELRELPYRTKRGEYFYPIVHYKYDRMPGSALGRTPMFDLIEKQKTRNRVEAIGEMILMRTSNPVWVVPTPGTTTEITGHVGQEIKYDPNQTNGAAPMRVEAAQMPPAIVEWLNRIDQDFIYILGASEITLGQRPLSVKSGFALQKVQEISNDRQTAVFTNYSIAVAESQQIALEVFRLISPTERYARIFGDNKEWTVKKIKATDLQGAVDVVCQPGAWTPKSHIERLATLEFFIQNGLIDIQDPVQKLRIHREYGMPGLLASMDADDAQIAREHDRWKNGGPLEISPFENSQMHLMRHLEKWKSEEFESVPPERKEVFLRHILATQYVVETGKMPPPGMFDQQPQGGAGLGRPGPLAPAGSGMGPGLPIAEGESYGTNGYAG
jgi:hypothetical protein